MPSDFEKHLLKEDVFDDDEWFSLKTNDDEFYKRSSAEGLVLLSRIFEKEKIENVLEQLNIG